MKEFLDELKVIHKKFSKFELAIVVIFLLLVLFIPYKPNIIGFSDVNIHRQKVNLAADHSKSFVVTTKEPVSITSLSVSGEVLGQGAASVYLIDKNGNKRKVFSNEQKGMRLITGFYGEDAEVANSIKTQEPVLHIKEESSIEFTENVKNAVPGEFISVCSDTCSLEESDSFKLLTYVEPGTTLIISEIDYTTVDK